MTQTESVPAKPMRKDAARNRDLLLAAARELFAERGLEASLDDIARRAGVGVGTAYRHFPDKDELAAAVLTQLLEELADTAEAALHGGDPWGALVELLETLVQAQARNRGLHEVVMGLRDLSFVDSVHDRLSAAITTLVQRARDAGQIRPDIEPSDVGVISMTLCQTAELGAELAPELWRRYLEMFLIALRAPGPVFTAPAVPSHEFDEMLKRHKKELLGRNR